MPHFQIKTPSEQLAEFLREQISAGRYRELMPGMAALAKELGTAPKTVGLALGMLEKEKLLVPQGPGKRRLIVLPENQAPPAMRFAILLYEPEDRHLNYLLDLLRQIREAGHTASFVPKTLTELGMEVRRVGNLVKATKADAWVVAGGSRSVLEWFAAQPFPTFGLFGRIVGVPIASTSPKKLPATQTALRLLVALGHRRIVMITRKERREPVPGFMEQAFLDALKAQGVPTGPYNLPDWEETPAGYRRLLDSLFLHSPPTALLVDGSALAVATFRHFAERGIKVPRDVSLICMDPDPAFAWCDPAIAHISYDIRPCLRSIVRWVDNVARGKEDRRKTSHDAKLAEGGTIGPPRG